MPTETLINLLKSLPYPDSMQFISGIPGVAFFPGGRGLWVDGDIDLANKKYMILGQDFDTLDGFQRSKSAGKENISSNKTWKNLLRFLDDAKIKPEECFFTNAIMGARKLGKNSGRSPALKDAQFIEACRKFFLSQLEIQKPQIILVLGREPAQFLAPLSEDLKHWRKIKSFTHLDAANEQIKKQVHFENGISSNFFVLTHPSFRPSNVHRRSFEKLNGHSAELAMLNTLK